MKYIYKLCISCLLFTAALYAQTVSPLKEATAGLFGAESDNITSVTGWNGIFFDKVLATASYGYLQSQNDASGLGTILNANVLNTAAMFNMGKSKILGGKIGVSYVGTFGSDMKFHDKTEGNAKAKGADMPKEHNHKIGLLIGLPGNKYGLRLGFDMGGEYSNVRQSPLTENSANVNALSFKPSLGFGAKLQTQSRYAFTPSAELTLSITNGGGSAAAAYSSGSIKGIGSDGKKFENTGVFRKYTPSASVGMGVTFPSKMGITTWSLGGKYAFSYTYMPEKYRRIITSGVLTEAIYRPDSAMSHRFNLTVSQNTTVSWRLALKASASIDLSYAYDLTGGSIKHTITASPAIQTTEVSNFMVAPLISGGVTYRISDNVLWFGGLVFRPIAYVMNNTKSYDEKVAVKDASVDIRNDIKTPFLTHFGMGLQFKLSPELGLQGAFVLKPTETSPVRTIQDAFGSNIRLSITWKDAIKE